MRIQKTDEQYLKDSAIDALPVDVSSSDVVLTEPSRALIIGTSGDLEVTTHRGNKVVLLNVPSGVLPLCVTTVWTANTTASDISALF